MIIPTQPSPVISIDYDKTALSEVMKVRFGNRTSQMGRRNVSGQMIRQVGSCRIYFFFCYVLDYWLDKTIWSFKKCNEHFDTTGRELVITQVVFILCSDCVRCITVGQKVIRSVSRQAPGLYYH